MEEKIKKPRKAPRASTEKKSVTAKKKEEHSASHLARAVGRRKEAVARVRVSTGPTVSFLVNGKDVGSYFPGKTVQQSIARPLVATATSGTYVIEAKIYGGGARSQADALRLGIARALLRINPEWKKTLRSEGLLTRDPRVKERKKPGLKRARRAPQFSKR